MSEDTKNELMELLQNGQPSIIADTSNLPQVKIVIEAADNSETKAVKENVEFTSNTVREAVENLKFLGQQTGNARFFEAIATLLNTLNNANNQLMKLSAEKSEQGAGNTSGASNGKSTTTNYVLMSGREAMRAVNNDEE